MPLSRLAENEPSGRVAIALDEILSEVEVPSLDVPDLNASSLSFRDESKDLFAEKSSTKSLFEEKNRAVWKDVQQAEARCDFSPNKVRISYRSSTKSLGLAKNRRHKERNFASLISARLATLLGVNFYEDFAECHSKHRVGAVFTLGKELLK